MGGGRCLRVRRGWGFRLGRGFGLFLSLWTGVVLSLGTGDVQGGRRRERDKVKRNS